MAEAFIVGPLLNLGFFLGKYLWKKYNGAKENKEYDHESRVLLNAVDSLAQFAHHKATEIQQINCQLGLSPNSLGLHSVTNFLNNVEILKWEIWSASEDAKNTLLQKKLKPLIKMQRIQGIHTRLTQLLV